jgi:hypothetical protein
MPDSREGVNPGADYGIYLYFRSLESIPTSSVTLIYDYLLGNLYLRSLNSELSSAPKPRFSPPPLVTSICDSFWMLALIRI